MVAHALQPSTQKREAMDQVLEATFGYTVSSRVA